ncbi:6553_t:CDS:2 [Diversispora eburnea]|uniref:6553_t:CDS:1 n=1 Tax=Diversispora eburnea TaxID=1213867 RepID=A0A9N8YQF5_9GLOM|nr:6553_t:CDS:2 [Diversispora eburnea]
MNRLGHFYICVPVPLDVIDNQEYVKGKVISLDPDIRTFITCYDPEGQMITCKVTKIKLSKSIHQSGSKTFRCDSCDLVIDGDANGARNNLLKRLTEGQVHT